MNRWKSAAAPTGVYARCWPWCWGLLLRKRCRSSLNGIGSRVHEGAIGDELILRAELSHLVASLVPALLALVTLLTTLAILKVPLLTCLAIGEIALLSCLTILSSALLASVAHLPIAILGDRANCRDGSNQESDARDAQSEKFHRQCP
jgi:hypothetical protein